MSAKRAILLVFDYGQIPATWMGPSKLLGMDKDIFRMYHLAVDSGCLPSNVTIVTDVKYKQPPWRYLHVREQPRVVTLPYPVCQSVLDVMTQFMAELSFQAKDLSQILVYYSGHGVSLNIAGNLESHMVLTTNKGERRYLSHKALNCVMNPVPTTEDRLTIPVVSPGLLGLSITNLEVAHHRKPLTNHSRLIIVDACQASTLSGLPFNFSKTFSEVSNTVAQNLTGVGCIATTLTQNAPSTVDGSPFTSIVIKALKADNLQQMYDTIYNTLPSYMKDKCTPVITSSHSTADLHLPFVTKSNTLDITP